MMRKSLIEAIQFHVANIAISASTLRNQGASGTVAAARRYLSSLKLKQFGVKEKKKFDAALNSETEKLRQALPRGANNWGTARKETTGHGAIGK